MCGGAAGRAARALLIDWRGQLLGAWAPRCPQRSVWGPLWRTHLVWWCQLALRQRVFRVLEYLSRHRSNTSP